MGLDKIGINLSSLGSINPPNITLPTTGKGVLEAIPTTASAVTFGYFPHILLTGFFTLLYLILSDKTPFGEFKYSDLRAFTLTAGIVTLFGLTLLEIGFISNLYIVGITTTLFIIGNIILLKTSPSP